MAIIGMYKVGGDGPCKEIGVALSKLSWNHVANFDGQTNLGFSFGCCNAAVAVNTDGAIAAGYRDSPANLSMASAIAPSMVAVYGSSRLYAGLDPVANNHIDPNTTNNPFSSSPQEQHAEQTAILTAQGLGLAFWQDDKQCCHLYVDFTPCSNCEPWLRARPENWVVHYGVDLAQKATFTKERKTRSRDLKNDARLKALADSRLQRLANAQAAKKAARREKMDQNRENYNKKHD